MRQPTLLVSAVVAAACALAPALLAQGPAIEHDPVGCVQAEHFPRLTARLSGETGRARVYFRASGTSAWYFVEMKPEAGLYAAALPKPKKDTKAFDYYIEALDTAMTQSRTADYSAAVVSGETCGGGKAMAAVASSARVVVGSPAGAPAVPAGFASSGIVTAAGAAAGVAAGVAAGSAGGGASTGLIVGIAAAGAAGVGVAVASGGGGGEQGSGTSGSPPPGTGPSPTPTPGPSPTVLNIDFLPSPPGIDVSVCAGRPLGYSSQVVVVRSDGTFDDVWSPSAPNTMRATGRADATTFQATVTCFSGSPSGSLSATGSGGTYNGTFSFAGSQGTIRVTSR